MLVNYNNDTLNNPVVMYLSGVSIGSRRTIVQSLRVVLDILGVNDNVLTFNWTQLDYPQIMLIRLRLTETYKYTTANKILSVLKGVYKQAFNLGLIDAEQYNRIHNIKNVSGESTLTGKEIAKEDFIKLYNTVKADTSSQGVRDLAILMMMFFTGMRRSSIVKLELSDINFETGLVLIREAKRNKTNEVFLPAHVLNIVKNWVNIRGLSEGALFNPIKQGIRALTDQTIYNIVQTRCSEAGIAACTPHDFRRTLTSQLLENGVDIHTVSKILGHSSISTTARYDRRSNAAKKDAIDTVDFLNEY